MKNYLIYVLLLAGFVTKGLSAADADTLRKVVAFRTENAPRIDGKPDEPIWKTATPTSDFIQSRPIEGQPSMQKTEVRVLYTDFAVYVGAWCYDTQPDSILRQLGKRDQEDLNADNFFFKIDPYNNQQDAYQFGVSASGVQSDSRFSDNTFDAVWNSAVSHDNSGWYVEIEIPYSAIRFPDKEEQLWGVQFTRYIRRSREFDMWSYVPSVASNPQLHWGHLSGIKNVKTPVRLSVVPYLGFTFNHEPVLDEGGSYQYLDAISYNMGADIKYGIDDRFTLDMTLLPDFGQVQSDRLIKNLGYQEVVYDENRPFFREAIELFSKGNLFYSRRIGKKPSGYFDVFDQLDPDESIKENPVQVKLLNAVKVSGRTDNGLGIGFFNAITDNAYAIINKGDGDTRKVLTEPMTNYNIIVLDQQFKNNSNIYFINTSTIRREGNEDANVSALGIKLSNKKNTFLVSTDGYISQNFQQDADAEGNVFTNSVGYRYSVGAEKLGGNFGYGAYRNVTSPEWDATDLGYFRIAGQNNTEAYFRFNRYKPWKFIRESYNNLNFYFSDDFRSGKLGDNSVSLNLFANLMSWNAVFGGAGGQFVRPYDFYEARQPGVLFHGLRYYYFYAGYSTDYRKKLAIDYTFNVSNFMDRFRWFGYNNDLSFRIRPNDKLFLIYKIAYYFDPFNVGFANFDENGSSIIGGRRLDTWENNIQANYTFRNNMWITLIARHYWITGEYKRYFRLDDGGELLDADDYSDNNNFNFNILNLDLVYEWRFSPGSILNIVYKNALTNETGTVSHNFGNNFNRIMSDPQSRTFTVKLLYYLDYLKVHGKIAHRYHKSPGANEASHYQRVANPAKGFHL